MSLTKYQVHDETSQVSYTTSLIYGVGFTSDQMGRLYVSCFQIRFLHIVSYLERYFCMNFHFFLFKRTTHLVNNMLSHLIIPIFFFQPNWLICI